MGNSGAAFSPLTGSFSGGSGSDSGGGSTEHNWQSGNYPLSPVSGDHYWNDDNEYNATSVGGPGWQ